MVLKPRVVPQAACLQGSKPTRPRIEGGRNQAVRLRLRAFVKPHLLKFQAAHASCPSSEVVRHLPTNC
eukprot:454166-Amphidinium_carterae.2